MSKPEAFHAYLSVGKAERIPVLEIDGFHRLGTTIGIDPHNSIPTGDYLDCKLEVESETDPYQLEFKAYFDFLGDGVVGPACPNPLRLAIYLFTVEQDYTLPIETIGADTYAPDTSALKPIRS